MKFNSQIQNLNKFAENVSNDWIKNEPMFFNSSLEFAMEQGKDITRSFIHNLPQEWRDSDCVFDSRVHMLMPGWYPAIPGYHHDDVPRPKIKPGQHFITAGQPDYKNPRYKSEHILGLVDAEICPTKFIIGDCDMSEIEEGELIYRKWDAEIKTKILNKDVELIEAEDRRLVYFNCDTFHTGDKVISNGWRWFGRVSRNTDRTKEITNE